MGAKDKLAQCMAEMENIVDEMPKLEEPGILLLQQL